MARVPNPGDFQEKPGAGKPHARICEGGAVWPSYSTTTSRQSQFDFPNYVSGQLDPGCKAIADKDYISIRSAARGLAKLKESGVINWPRRCIEEVVDVRFTLRQLTNAYAVLPANRLKSESIRRTRSVRHEHPIALGANFDAGALGRVAKATKDVGPSSAGHQVGTARSGRPRPYKPPQEAKAHLLGGYAYNFPSTKSELDLCSIESAYYQSLSEILIVWDV